MTLQPSETSKRTARRRKRGMPLTKHQRRQALQVARGGAYHSGQAVKGNPLTNISGHQLHAGGGYKKY